MKPPKWLPRFDAVASFLENRNPREKYMLVAFVGVFLLVLDYFLWLVPVFEIYNTASPKIGPLREELKSLSQDYKNKDAIHQKWQEAKKGLAEKENMFIAPNGTPALLENLSKQAQKAGVKITSLEPFETRQAAKAKSSYTPLPIQVKAMAGTHEFGALLSGLESGRTLFRIQDLRISSNPLNERKHLIELSMEVYKREE